MDKFDNKLKKLYSLFNCFNLNILFQLQCLDILINFKVVEGKSFPFFFLMLFLK